MMENVRYQTTLFSPWLAILVGVHVVVAFVLASGGWYLTGPSLLAAITIPLSQTALVAIWSATRRMNQVQRFALPICGLFFGWFLLSRILTWGTGDLAAPGWALTLVVQVVTILFLISLFGPQQPHDTSDPIDEREHRPTRIRFRIGTLMLWTTVIAIGFGFVQIGQRFWDWTPAFFRWSIVSAYPLIGLTSGLIAVCWLWAIGSRGFLPIWLRILVALTTTAKLTAIQWYAATWMSGTAIFTLGGSSMLVAGQVAIICASLVTLRALESNRAPRVASE